jgi:hypothetical protein
LVAGAFLAAGATFSLPAAAEAEGFWSISNHPI